MKFTTRAAMLVSLSAALCAPICRADDESAKRRDRQPAAVAPAITGKAIRPDQWKLQRRDIGGGVAGAFDAKNVTLLSWLPLNALPGGSTSGADCWGYTSPSGREYALIGIERGTAFVEVTDPVNPVVVGYVQGSASLWHDVTVIGDYAYACSDSSGPGIQIIDMRNIDSGVVKHVKNWAPNGLSTIHTLISNPQSKRLFANGANIGNGGLVCIDAADPENLVLKGAWTNQYVHESQAVTINGKEIVFAFTAGPYYGYSKGFAIIDATDMNSPALLSLISYPNIQFCHQGWVTPDFKYVYINDELDNLNRTRIIDVSNLSNPVPVGDFVQARPSIDHNLYLKDGKIYEANYTSGLRIFDMADPLAPKEIAYFDTHPESDAASFNGAWGNYPFFDSGTVLISDLERGLFVVRHEVGQLVFDFPDGLPDTLQPGKSAQVRAAVTEEEITLDPASVRLNLSLNGAPFNPIAMQPDGKGAFTASLPASECFDHLNFYFSASATDGRTFNSPAGAPAETYAADVRTGAVVAFEDHFETEIPGWVVQNENLQTGAWVRGNPIGTGAQPEDAADGTMCYFTGQGTPNGGIGEADIDGGPTRLISPALDLSASPEAVVEYWLWYYSDQGIDTFYVDVSNNNGQSWKNVEAIYGGSGGWKPMSFRVADYVAPTAQVKVRFSASDNPNDSITEAALDGFRAVSYQCEEDSCAPDLNGDGTLDLFDFLEFGNLFNAKDARADWNDDGVFDLFDFLGYVNSFNEGC